MPPREAIRAGGAASSSFAVCFTTGSRGSADFKAPRCLHNSGRWHSPLPSAPRPAGTLQTRRPGPTPMCREGRAALIASTRLQVPAPRALDHSRGRNNQPSQPSQPSPCAVLSKPNGSPFATEIFSPFFLFFPIATNKS